MSKLPVTGDHVVTIDTPARVKAVAWLASYHHHKPSRVAIQSLALAVGVECRGGRIYPPEGWSNYLARGWDRFIDRLSYTDSDILWIRERMATYGARVGTTVTIDPVLAERIRSLRKAPS